MDNYKIKGYKLIEVTKEENKRISFSVLEKIDAFCRENHIVYYLGYGTLLGAVRHGGFIPWDDDIDILMPRKDYEKFIELGKNGFDGVRVQDPYQKNAIHAFAKAYDENTIKIEDGVDYTRYTPIGIDVDVFPIDGQPDDDEVFIKEYHRRVYWSKWFSASISEMNGSSFKFGIIKIMARLVGKNFFLKRMFSMVSKYDFDDAKNVGVLTAFSDGIRDRHPRSIFDNVDELIFEGKKFVVMGGYDSYLKSIYGDYMTPPPENKRCSHHGNKIYKLIKNEEENSKC